MPAEELENQLRHALAATAARYPHPEQAQQRLLARTYHPRRHRPLATALTATATAATATALALALTTGTGPGHTGTGAGAAHRSRTAPATIQTAAFTLTTHPNGTTTLTINIAAALHPAALQHALAQHHIPALVTTNTACTSTPPPPDPTTTGALTIHQPPTTTPHLTPGHGPHGQAPGPGKVKPLIAHTTMTINPAALPPATELAFNLTPTHNAFAVTLITTHHHTCHTASPTTPGSHHNHNPHPPTTTK